MSNRARRHLLRELRLAASVSNHAGHDPEVESMEDWNRWQRYAYRSISREPLRFSDNKRPDPGLIKIQIRNRPETFDPLREPTPEPPEFLASSIATDKALALWRAGEECIWAALGRLETLKIGRLRFNWGAWSYWRNVPNNQKRGENQPEKDPAAGFLDDCKDFPPAIHRAFRRLRNNLMAVHQYGDDGNPWFPDHGQAARYILNIAPEGKISEAQLYALLTASSSASATTSPAKISEAQLYALLTLAAGRRALMNLQQLPDDPATWGSDELAYAGDLIQEAERWMAYADSHSRKSVKGGKHPKGSKGIRDLAGAMKKENPKSSAHQLFDDALALCRGGLPCCGYSITVNAEGQLVSAKPDGGRDGRGPVGLSGWKKIIGEIKAAT